MILRFREKSAGQFGLCFNLSIGKGDLGGCVSLLPLLLRNLVVIEMESGFHPVVVWRGGEGAQFIILSGNPFYSPG